MGREGGMKGEREGERGRQGQRQTSRTEKVKVEKKDGGRVRN